jgi:predicted lipoprotein with Yx(FWY)xxD motif
MTRRTTTTTLFASAAAILLIALAGCGSSDTSSSAAPRSTAPPNPAARPAPTHPTLAVGHSSHGSILVDSHGRTVYMFGLDSGKKSACTGECAAAWPPVTATGTPTVGKGARAALVGTTSRPDGTHQVTYHGHPLYTFIKDQQAGDTKGQGLVAFGGTWSVLTPAGVPVAPPPPPPTKAAPPPPPPPTTMAPSPEPEDPGVPQGGGGDGDADNNGGPDDGDGGV